MNEALLDNREEEFEGSRAVLTKQKIKKKRRSSFSMKNYFLERTLSQGVFEIALLMENSSQLKYFLLFGENYEFFTVILFLVMTCILLLTFSGCLTLLVMVGDVENRNQQKVSSYFNETVTVSLSLGVIFHVIVSALSIKISDHFYPHNDYPFEPEEEEKDEDFCESMEKYEALLGKPRR